MNTRDHPGPVHSLFLHRPGQPQMPVTVRGRVCVQCVQTSNQPHVTRQGRLPSPCSSGVQGCAGHVVEDGEGRRGIWQHTGSHITIIITTHVATNTQHTCHHVMSVSSSSEGERREEPALSTPIGREKVWRWTVQSSSRQAGRRKKYGGGMAVSHMEAREGENHLSLPQVVPSHWG